MNIWTGTSYATPMPTNLTTPSHISTKAEEENIDEKKVEREMRSSKARRRVDKTLILEIQGELGRPQKDTLQVTWPTTTYAVKMNQVRSQLPELWNKQNRERKAAITIQKNVRGFLVRHLLIETLSNNFIKEANEKAVMIQKSWRMNLAMSKARELALSQVVNTDYDKAEEKIGWFMIMANVRINSKYYTLCKKMWEDMIKATIKIQAFGRMVGIRTKYIKVLFYESIYNSIKWNGCDESVQVVGTFTQPEWRIKLELDYCSFRKIFVKYLDSLEVNKIYEYSFIIDGKLNAKVLNFVAEEKSPLIAVDIQDTLKAESLGMTTIDESPRIVEIKREKLSITCPGKEWSSEGQILSTERKDCASDETLTQTTDRDLYDSARINERKDHETLCNPIA